MHLVKVSIKDLRFSHVKVMSVAAVKAHRVSSLAIAERCLRDALTVEDLGQSLRFLESLGKFDLFFLVI